MGLMTASGSVWWLWGTVLSLMKSEVGCTPNKRQNQTGNHAYFFRLLAEICNKTLSAWQKFDGFAVSGTTTDKFLSADTAYTRKKEFFRYTAYLIPQKK